MSDPVLAIKWEELTYQQQNEFLLDGNIELLHWYLLDLNFTVNKDLYTEKIVNGYLDLIKYNIPGESYSTTDSWLYKILKRHTIANMSVAIMGSIKPWYEAVCLAYNGIPVTLEYNVIEPSDKRLKMLHINDCFNHPQFDAAFSISSFEHDGLGRYGDPINPFGDLKAMQNMKKILKKDGLLFLAVPVGKDKLVWNAHRVYGEIRLPHLLDGWELIDQEGFDENLYKQDRGTDGSYQPVFVLKNI